MRHRVAGVECQIEQSVPDLGRIGAGEPQIRRAYCLDTDRLAEGTAEHFYFAAEEQAQVHSLRLERLIAPYSQEATRQPRPIQSTVEDLVCEFDLLWRVPQSVDQHLDAADDNAKQIIKIMGYTTCELAQRPHLLGLTQHFLGMKPVRDLVLKFLMR